MLFALKHALGLALLGSLFWATGFLVAAGSRRLESLTVGAQLVRIALGMVTWIYLLFAFASVGWLRAQIVLPIASMVLIVAAWRATVAVKQELAARRRAFETGSWRGVARGLALWVLPGLTLAGIFFQALAPQIGWDDDVYHLTLPKLYLAHSGFRPVPFSVYSNWPLNIEMLFGLAMMGGDYVLAKLVHTFFLSLLLLAVFRLCRQHTSSPTALLASLLVLANPVVIFEAEYAYVDIAFAFFFLIAVSCAIDYLRTDDVGALLKSGLSCGALAGIKLSGLAGVFCVLVLVLTARPLRFGGRRLRTIGSALLLPTLLLALPWYVKSYLYTGNPLYPMLFRQFGGRDWDESLGQQFFAWQHAMGMGRSLYDYLALPVRVILDGGEDYDHFDGQIGKFWLVAAPLACLVALRLKQSRPYLISAGVYFVFWALSSQQLRFLIALLPPLAVATGLAIHWLDELLTAHRPRALFRVAMWLAAGAALMPILYPTWRRGAREAQALIEDGPRDRSTEVPEGYSFINATAATDAKIMLLDTNHGFFLERAYIADSFFEASQMRLVLSQARSEDELADILKRLELDYLYLARRDTGVQYPGVLAQLLSNRDRAGLAYQCADGGCSIYELRR